MNLIDQLKAYFRSSRTELQAVAWPSREETMRYTLLVVGVSVVFGLFFGLFDFGLTRLVESTVTARTANVQQAAPTETSSTPEILPINPSDIKVETSSGSASGITVTPVTPTTTTK